MTTETEYREKFTAITKTLVKNAAAVFSENEVDREMLDNCVSAFFLFYFENTLEDVKEEYKVEYVLARVESLASNLAACIGRHNLDGKINLAALKLKCQAATSTLH